MINKYSLYAIILITLALMFISCSKTAYIDEKTEDLPSVSNENNQKEEQIYTSEGLSHEPYGWDNLYEANEVPLVWWNRSPRDPKAGEMIQISVAAWKDAADMDIWLEWELNDETMELISCKHMSNLDDYGQASQTAPWAHPRSSSQTP